mmetsp:Transcript_24722/g.36247  ORF Transcript_24722/g.36247 Transcript_24722/m.36247 type:complete len:152 (-) Transcript_24722:387-842(-)|eukprot:CAMPEP_0195515818 /NCGR_PEP_ID=MMETSP0794_2-20130614/6754_1 /TAXON_ID=515487 /ORGANISM="Stephanopyxis turris, Strain CCMP 815" /LENGTH=151 /DNA_ID=CAMNT_0040644303 /DNA_START=1 /DNA_END=456 /DNA_ORIENTATION=+
MVSTTTKKHRPKRPDARPNGKRRLKAKQALVKKLEAKDLKVTRIPKSEQIEREVSGVLRKPKTPASDIRSRALRKLLRQIEALADKQKAGEVLNDAQKTKLSRFDNVVAELEELLDVDLGSDDEDEDEDVEDVADKSDESPIKRKKVKKQR